MRSMRLLVVAVLVVVLSLSPVQVNAATLTLTAVADASIREGYPDTNYGNWVYLEAGRNWDVDGWHIHRALVKFDLSSIPLGSTIVSAELKLFAAQVSSGVGPGTLFFVYRVTHDWVEGAGTNGVTWNEANHIVAGHPGSCTSWTPGGEWTTEDAASAGYPGNDVWATWTVTEIVQDWLCGAANYGFILIFPTGEAANAARYGYFDALEQFAGAPFEKPVLVVDFGPPGGCPAVGGVVTPVNTFAVLSPWLAVIGLVGCVATVVAVARKRRP